jgi:hypothetical protein
VNTRVQWLANISQEAQAILDRWARLGKMRRLKINSAGPPPKKVAARTGGTQRDQSSAEQVASIAEESKRFHWALVALSADEFVEWVLQQRLVRFGKERR